MKAYHPVLFYGSIITRGWLAEHGFDRHAVDNLVKSHQLVSISPGVYTRPGSALTWEGVVHFLQSGLRLNLTIGGRTALDLLGLSHYLPLGAKKVVHLYGTDKPPTWINRLQLKTTFQWHSAWELLGHRYPIDSDQVNPLHSFTRYHAWKTGQADLVLSSPERAFLETLAGVPGETSVEHADQLLQGMTSMSPHSLQILLEECHNIKVRRLFFWLADRHRYPWLEKLRRERIDLGAGKRVLVKDGRLDKTYNITIPREL